MGTVQGESGVRGTWPWRAAARMIRRGDGRAPLWIELAIVAWLFWLYDVINDFAPVRRRLALHNALGLVSFERSLNLNPELGINRWMAGHATLALIASYDYFFSHAIVTFGVLVVLWWRLPKRYIRLRTLLVIINLIAFVVFWRYPLAPPRSFPGLGYIDVIARSGALVSWHSGALEHDADQFAAMPSLHVAWAMWSAVGVWHLTRRVTIRAIAVAYPVITCFVVLGTGNHYLIDVLAGAGTVPVAAAVQFAAARAFALLRRRRVTEREHSVHGVPAQP